MEEHPRPSQTGAEGLQTFVSKKEGKERWVDKPAGCYLRSRGKLSFEMNHVTCPLAVEGEGQSGSSTQRGRWQEGKQ